MNWGKGIIIGMVLFMGFIITMVTIMMQQKVDLVTDNYYLKELEYDNTYRAQINYENANAKIETQIVNNELNIQVPTEFKSDSIHAYLFKPNDANGDLEWSFDPDVAFKMSLNKLPQGNYELTLTGKRNGETFEYHTNLKW